MLSTRRSTFFWNCSPARRNGFDPRSFWSSGCASKYTSYFGGGFIGRCPGQGITITADSAEFYDQNQLYYLLGNVKYREKRVHLDAEGLRAQVRDLETHNAYLRDRVASLEARLQRSRAPDIVSRRALRQPAAQHDVRRLAAFDPGSRHGFLQNMRRQRNAVGLVQRPPERRDWRG